ncbi:MAG: aldo/keto reductase [Pseudomonadota bacterium]
MEQVQLGKTGLRIGAVAYGCWRFTDGDVGSATARIRTALEHGMTLIDTADIYGYGTEVGFGGAEALLGDVFRTDPGLRSKIVLATKAGVDLPKPYNSHPDYLAATLDASLARLGTDHVELFYIHRPDLTVPFADVAGALNAMLASGKVRHIGVSNFTAAQTRALQAYLDAPIAALQSELSVWQQATLEDGVHDYAMETGASVFAWSPLAGGALATGKAPGGADSGTHMRVMMAIDKLAMAKGVTRTHIALAFVRALHARPIPVIGTQSPERIREAAAAVQVELAAREVYDLIEARRGTAMP